MIGLILPLTGLRRAIWRRRPWPTRTGLGTLALAAALAWTTPAPATVIAAGVVLGWLITAALGGGPTVLHADQLQQLPDGRGRLTAALLVADAVSPATLLLLLTLLAAVLPAASPTGRAGVAVAVAATTGLAAAVLLAARALARALTRNGPLTGARSGSSQGEP